MNHPNETLTTLTFCTDGRLDSAELRKLKDAMLKALKVAEAQLTESERAVVSRLLYVEG